MALNTCITLGNRKIGPDYPPYFVAELSGNHQLCIEQARALIKAAKDSGADAVKIQTYTADTLTLPVRNGQFRASGPWENLYLYDLYQTSYTPWEWHEDLADYARKLGITFFSTPFDETAVDFLEKTIHPPFYKVASFEINHIPLLKRIAQTGKPVFLSTGLASVEDLEEALATLRDNGCKDIVLLKCVSAYPADPAGFNLKSLLSLKKYNPLVGLSDHSLSSAIVMGAIVLGACLVEKHFVLSRKSDAIDSSFSIEPKEFADMVKDGKILHKGLGRSAIEISEQEMRQRKFRRSIYVSAPIKQGEAFTDQNIKVVRPHFGLHPRYWDKVLGQKAKRDLAPGHPLNAQDVAI